MQILTSKRIIAHRGYRQKYPENTMAAFEAALNAGADMIELDVTLTLDRKIVVIHDDTLERTTNGHGYVSGHLMSELKRLDAGSWFDPTFRNEPIPELRDVLNQMGNRIFINIEIKPEAFESESLPDSIENQTMTMLLHGNLEKTVLISSFHPQILERMRSISETLQIAMLTENQTAYECIETCCNLNVFSWNPAYSILDKPQVSLMHRHGIRVLPYTVNSPSEFKELLRMGIDGVFTDDPPTLLRILGR